MKPYTVDEIYELLISVSCRKDVEEIVGYLRDNKQHYTEFDKKLFQISITMYFNIFSS